LRLGEGFELIGREQGAGDERGALQKFASFYEGATIVRNLLRKAMLKERGFNRSQRRQREEERGKTLVLDLLKVCPGVAVSAPVYPNTSAAFEGNSVRSYLFIETAHPYPIPSSCFSAARACRNGRSRFAFRAPLKNTQLIRWFFVL